METIAFIDCSAGVAGDMLLGALIDAGAPLDEIVRGLCSLRGIDGEWTLRTSRVWKGPGRIAGTKVHVDSIYNHRELLPPGTSSNAETVSHAYSHDHGHNHDNDHDHSHDHEHSHDHAHSHDRSHDYGHSHDHGHDHIHESVRGEPMRNLESITRLVQDSSLSAWAKAQSIAVFTLLAEAEAHTHGSTVDAVHFHEVGAVDSIVDTVGCVLALDLLGVRRVVSSPVPFSSGTVKCMHGVLPVPPPATLRLMIGVPVCAAPKGAKGELVTPTGISLVKALSSAFGEPPPFVPTHTGVGAGTKEFPFHANIVRVAIGTVVGASAMTLTPASATSPATSPATPIVAPLAMESPYSQENVLVLETNLDDVNPQVVGYVFERLLQQDGPALDVWTQPIQMKKSRPGLCLSVLCQPQHEDAVLRVLFEETTTLGVRRKALERVFLRREIIAVRAFERSVDVKLGYYGTKLVNVYPEYEHCKEIARATALPLLDIIHKVQSLAHAFLATQ